MKVKLVFYSLLFLISCNDNAADKPTVQTLQKKDTTVARASDHNPYSPIDISPMDISYFPDDYPIQKMSGKTTAPPVMRVIYSRPHKQGRKIFGLLVPYGDPWRLGANEATEIELFQTVSIQDKKIPKGHYVLYCIPYQDHWTIVFNSNIFSWGLKPDTSKDLYKFDTPAKPTTESIEYFTMMFEKTGDHSVDLLMTWDEVLVRLPIKI